MTARKTIIALFVYAACVPVALANCWGEFEREGKDQFGYILLFTTASNEVLTGEARFWAFVGPGDTITHSLMPVILPPDTQDAISHEVPVQLRVVATVERRERRRWLIVTRILKTEAEANEARMESEKKYGPTCPSSFASGSGAA